MEVSQSGLCPFSKCKFPAGDGQLCLHLTQVLLMVRCVLRHRPSLVYKHMCSMHARKVGEARIFQGWTNRTHKSGSGIRTSRICPMTALDLPVVDSACALAENVELAPCGKSRYSGRWSRTIAIHLAFISLVVEAR